MEEKFGIQATKEVIVFLLALLKAVVESMADGRFSVLDIMHFFTPLRLLAPAFKDIGKVKAEILDLSEAEKKELCDLVAAQFKIDNKVVEGYLVAAIQAVVSLLDLIPFSREIKK